MYTQLAHSESNNGTHNSYMRNQAPINSPSRRSDNIFIPFLSIYFSLSFLSFFSGGEIGL
uniref:Uncharacterized protein n=1 Tax=Nelumbo nucifera TaxID=4432 RepID=A0A822XWY4_NELNU|nr:TPA_asm: hypothetical protein HUJ06_027612 [Nelumbo nucifera]